MKRILPHYYKYMSENPSTLLVKIFGMHRVKMYHLNRKIHFVIMASVFDTTEVIHQIFDLKGSLIGRSATEAERANGGVLKDNDLVNDGVKFHLGSKKDSFIQQIRKDAHFLATLNIMDYSLLVGIHDRDKRITASKRVSVIGAAADESGRSQTPFRASIAGRTAEQLAILDSLHGELFVADSDAPGSPSRRSGKRHSLTTTAMPTPSPEKMSRRRRASSGENSVRNINQESERHLQTEETVDTSLEPQLAGISNDTAEEPAESSEEEGETDDDDADDEHNDDGDSDPDETPEQRHERQLRFRERLSAESPFAAVSDPSTPISTLRQSASRSPRKRPLSQALTSGLSRLSSILDDGTMESNSVRGSVTKEFEVMPSEADRISKIFRDQATLFEMSLAECEEVAVYGPGASTKHPWTTRADNGINCRDPITNQRGKYIYFVGVIDILQQYNTFKRIETIYKVCTLCSGDGNTDNLCCVDLQGIFSDRTQISSVPAKDYADRFIKFFEDNVD